MPEYPWNEKNNTFTWPSSLYNPFKEQQVIMILFWGDIRKYVYES